MMDTKRERAVHIPDMPVPTRKGYNPA